MSSLFERCARRGELVVLAGAGVSAGKPSSLPGWWALNAAIFRVLCRRLEQATSRPDWLAQLIPVVDQARQANLFPPDYQAQLIEEACGDRYFRGLQALDVDAINTGHDGIAALAAAGALRAILTTNFDRLIERALDARGVPYVVARDDAEYVTMLERLSSESHALPLIKIHGCVSDHRSMIDTLKQRKRGRAKHLEACLDRLHASYWLYLGFSAADLESDAGYLGLLPGAARSIGATYVAYPGGSGLGPGAKLLLQAHGERGKTRVAHITTFLEEACLALGIPGPARIPDDVALGTAQFQAKLEAWADGLSGAATGLCLAAILEAVGEAEPAVRILDRLIRKDLFDERDTADYRALQVQYGRLGAAWGRFIAVPDLNGLLSNASVESTQSLLRAFNADRTVAAGAWLACMWLWMDNGANATSIAAWVLRGWATGTWEDVQPRSDEEAVDAWLAAAQVFVINAGSVTLGAIVGTADAALSAAIRCGDVVRAARVVAMKALALAETPENVPTVLEAHAASFLEATRVGDGVALGIRALALGRWHIGIGGRAHFGTDRIAEAARRSLTFLEEAMVHFRNQGMDPWDVLASVQRAKAHADLQEFDEAQTWLNAAGSGVNRFSALGSHFFEAVGQLRAMVGDDRAGESFRAAFDAAKESGLGAREELLTRYVEAFPYEGQPSTFHPDED